MRAARSSRRLWGTVEASGAYVSKAKAKQRRQTAHTATAGSHTARTSQQPTPPAPAPSRLIPRDAVTGEPLQTDTVKLLLPDYDQARRSEDRAPIPYAMHTQQVETERRHRDLYAVANTRRLGGTIGTFAGGLRFSPAFGEYIHDVRPADVERMTANWRVWWRNPYLVRGVRKRLGSQVTDALLLLYASGRNYAATAKLVGKPWEWLARHEPRAWQAANKVAQGIAN